MKRNLAGQLEWCRTMQWTLLAGTLLAALVIWLAEIRPARARLAELDERAAAGRAQLRDDRYLTFELAAAQQSIDQLHTWMTHFDQRLPKQPDLAPLVRDLSALGKDESLSNLTWRPLESQGATGSLAQLPIRLSFQAGFPSLADFLRRAEQLPRLTRVGELDLKTTPAAGAGAGMVDVEMTVDAYYGEQ